MKNTYYKILTIVSFALGLGLSSARATDDVDLTAVTDAITSTKTAILAKVPLVLTAALALMAIAYGAKWLIKLWKSHSK